MTRKKIDKSLMKYLEMQRIINENRWSPWYVKHKWKIAILGVILFILGTITIINEAQQATVDEASISASQNLQHIKITETKTTETISEENKQLINILDIAQIFIPIIGILAFPIIILSTIKNNGKN